MKKNFEIIKDNPLFEGITFSDFSKMYDCLSAQIKCYKKNEVILLAGDEINFVGIVLKGNVRIVKEDINGNRNILTEIEPSQIFAEVFACAEVYHSPVNIEAVNDCEIMLFNYRRIITTCNNPCFFHNKLTENMLKIIARKNLMLNQKIEVLSKRTTREKLICFFDIYRGAATKFVIPYNREELANFLCVDRSAMSNELCKMRDEGILTFNKNQFELL